MIKLGDPFTYRKRYFKFLIRNFKKKKKMKIELGDPFTEKKNFTYLTCTLYNIEGYFFFAKCKKITCNSTGETFNF